MRSFADTLAAVLFILLLGCLAPAVFLSMRAADRRWRRTRQVSCSSQKWLIRAAAATAAMSACDVITAGIGNRVAVDAMVFGAWLYLLAGERRVAQHRASQAAAEQDAHVENSTVGAAAADRPTHGHIHHPDGTATEIRYIPTGEPGVFAAVTVDGEPIRLDPGDTLCTGGSGAAIKTVVVKTIAVPPVAELPDQARRPGWRAFVAALSRRTAR